MNCIPPWLRRHIDQDSYYKKCARLSRDCAGRITIEHTLVYSGRQVQEVFALIPLCVWHHLEKGLNKRINREIAVARATSEELAKYPRNDWVQKYGKNNPTIKR